MTVRNIVVTGATRGLGRSLVHGFSEHGHRVIGCGRSGRELESLRREIESQGTPDPESAPDLQSVDLRSDVVAEWGRSIVDRYGAPDLLVANAGVIHRSAPLWELAPEETERVIDTNVTGVLRTLHAFLPSMVGRGAGVVALLSSGWGRSVSPEVSVYCATKWAIEGLAQSLALELPEGMASVAVNPGIIDTEMLRSAFGEGAGSYPGPKEWARRAVPFFLALGSKDNGESLTV